MIEYLNSSLYLAITSLPLFNILSLELHDNYPDTGGKEQKHTLFYSPLTI
jgi:hypothetical protein